MDEKLRQYLTGTSNPQTGHPIPELTPTERNASITEATRPTQAMSLQDHARRLVFDRLANRLIEKTDTHYAVTEDDVFVVWFTKTLKNWKAMVSTKLPDGRYYEVTHNGEAGETYIDTYVKVDNVCIPDTAFDLA